MTAATPAATAAAERHQLPGVQHRRARRRATGAARGGSRPRSRRGRGSAWRRPPPRPAAGRGRTAATWRATSVGVGAEARHADDRVGRVAVDVGDRRQVEIDRRRPPARRRGRRGPPRSARRRRRRRGRPPGHRAAAGGLEAGARRRPPRRGRPRRARRRGAAAATPARRRRWRSPRTGRRRRGRRRRGRSSHAGALGPANEASSVPAATRSSSSLRGRAHPFTAPAVSPDVDPPVHEQEEDEDGDRDERRAGHDPAPVGAAGALVERLEPHRQVWRSGRFMITRAKMNSFQAWMKAKIPVATSPGATSGSVTVKKARIRLDPSTSAASSRSAGMPPTKPRSVQIVNGRTNAEVRRAPGRRRC